MKTSAAEHKALVKANSLVGDREKAPAEGFAIGSRIKEVLEEEGRTVTWLAQQMGCSREYLYKVFSRTWISTDLLVTISEAMRHDFFRDFSRRLRYKKRRGVREQTHT